MSVDIGLVTSVHRKVLIVEDEAIIAMDIEHNLRNHGCEIAGLASSGVRPS